MNQVSRPLEVSCERISPAALAAIWVTALLVLLLLFQAGEAQAVADPNDDSRPVDSEKQAEIIDSVSAALNEVYVFPDVAAEMAEYMRQRYKDKAYKDLTTTRQFTEALTEDLREISKDLHLRVGYVPDEHLEFFLDKDSLSDEDAERIRQEELRREKYANFDFEKVERMSGNVGYLKFNSFAQAEYAGATAVSALNFLANCDALIIDLRENGGGNPSMIQLITSYFFEEPVHLNSFYIRKEDSIKQFWTQSHVQGPRMTDVELYVLTSSNTFSGAEEFTYNLKNLERATIVGETTGGGAHPVNRRLFADLNVAMSLPFGRAINPITGTNWEGTGIEPHIQVPGEDALDVAYLEALKKLRDKADDQERKESLTWIIEGKEALKNPATVAPEILQSYVGTYGPRTIVFENGELYYQREGRPKFRMVPMAADLFCFEELDYFRIKVNVDADGNPTELVGMYSGGHMDVTPRDK